MVLMRVFDIYLALLGFILSLPYMAYFLLDDIVGRKGLYILRS